MKPDKIIKEFRESFKDSSLFDCWDGCQKDIEQFLLQALKKQREEICKKLEGMEKNIWEKTTSEEDSPDLEYIGYNQAISEIISKIK